MILREPFALLVIVTAALLLGAPAVSLFGKRFWDDPLEFLFAGLATGVLVLGWLALLLAELGCFSLGLLGALWIFFVLVLGTGWRQRIYSRRARSPLTAWQVNRWEIVALSLWGLVAGWLFFRPHEFVAGAADAGVYVNLAASIAHTGGILIHDPVLAALDPNLYGALLRTLPPSEPTPYYLVPAFYVPGNPPGLIIPQFYPLHPVWQAVGYALGGLRAELWVTPLWGWLGALAVYFTMRRLWGWRAGLLALAALSLTAMQVWFSRYPTTEVLTQYLLWTGAWALIAWLDKREPRGLWAMLAASALGEVFLTRIDAYVLLAVPLLAGIWLWRTHDWRHQDRWFFLPFIALTGHSLLHGVLLSGPYFFGLLSYGRALISRTLVVPLLLLVLATLTLTGFSLSSAQRARLSAWGITRRPLWSAAAAILLASIAIFAYFVRPDLGEVKVVAYWYGGGTIPNLDRENLVRLGWYLGPGGLALGVAGTCWMLIKELNRRTAFLLGVGLFFSLFYLWRIQANPHQIYAMRRYVPVVLPFLIIAAAFLINWLWVNLRGKTRWFAAVGLTLVWFSGILFSARGFVSQVDYRGIISQLERFNSSLPANSVLVFGDAAPIGIGDGLGTPLHFLYGHDVFSLRDPNSLDPESFTEAIQGWQRAGRHVYWISVPGGPGWPVPGLILASPTSYRFDMTILEHAYDHKPTALIVESWQFSLAEISGGQ